MIGVLKKIWDFAGEEQDNIRKSMILGFFYAVFHMFQIAAIYVVVLALVGGSTDSARPRMLASRSPRACHAGAESVEPPTRASTTT